MKQKAGTPPEAVVDLSPDPMQFKHNFPATFNAVFGSDLPAHPKISIMTVLSVWEGTKMRVHPRPGSSFGPSAEPMQSFQRFMEVAMHSMHAVQSGEPRLQLYKPSPKPKVSSEAKAASGPLG